MDDETALVTFTTWVVLRSERVAVLMLYRSLTLVVLSLTDAGGRLI